MPGLRIALTMLALLVAMGLCIAIGLRQRVGAVLLALLSFVWLTVDREFEGAVLITVSQAHGLVVSDLVGIAGLIVAAWLWWRLSKSR